MLKSLRSPLIAFLLLHVFFLDGSCMDPDQPEVSSKFAPQDKLASQLSASNGSVKPKSNLPDLNIPLKEQTKKHQRKRGKRDRRGEYDKKIEKLTKLGKLEKFRENERSRMKRYHANLPIERKLAKAEADSKRLQHRLSKSPSFEAKRKRLAVEATVRWRARKRAEELAKTVTAKNDSKKPTGNDPHTNSEPDTAIFFNVHAGKPGESSSRSPRGLQRHSTEPQLIPDLNQTPPSEPEELNKTNAESPIDRTHQTRSPSKESESIDSATERRREKGRKSYANWYAKLTPEQKKARSRKNSMRHRAKIQSLPAEEQIPFKRKANERVKKSRSKQTLEERRASNRRYGQTFRDRERKKKQLSESSNHPKD